MAASQRKARRRTKPSWLLSCFGFLGPGPSEAKKTRKTGGRRRWFRLCLPKIRVINCRRKKVSLDAQVAAIKATQRIMFEASKVEHLNKPHHHHHVSSAHDKLNELPKAKERLQIDNRVHHDQHKIGTFSKQGRTSSARYNCNTPNTNKDSFIGASIMLVTLAIIGILGKLCAILCISAWFYCVPLLKGAKPFNHGGPKDKEDTKSNSNLVLYRKKEVLGVLPKDHNDTI